MDNGWIKLESTGKEYEYITCSFERNTPLIQIAMKIKKGFDAFKKEGEKAIIGATIFNHKVQFLNGLSGTPYKYMLQFRERKD